MTIGPGQTEATAEILFEPGFRVDGHVTRGGRPVTAAMVSAMPEGGERRGANGRTDEAGAFVLEGLQEGRYTFMANSLSGGAPIRRTVDVAGDATVDLEAPPARLAFLNAYNRYATNGSSPSSTRVSNRYNTKPEPVSATATW